MTVGHVGPVTKDLKALDIFKEREIDSNKKRTYKQYKINAIKTKKKLESKLLDILEEIEATLNKVARYNVKRNKTSQNYRKNKL